MDNLLQYLRNHFKDRLIISGEIGDLLIWGERTQNGVRLLGLSCNVAANIRPGQKQLRQLLDSGTAIAASIGVPIMRIVYPLDLITNPQATLRINNQVVNKVDAPAIIQGLLGTRYNVFGTSKDVNKQINDVFHEWARAQLPKDYVRNDIDAILLTPEYELRDILEIKRSPSRKPDKWTPYVEDIRNYYMGDLLAKRAGMRFITLNHPNKFVPVNDDTTVGIHFIQRVILNPENIQSTRTLVQAREVIDFLDN